MRESFWHGRLSWKDFFKAVYREYNHDNVADTAAVLGYYFVYSLFPFLFFLTTLAAYIPHVQSSMGTLLSRAHALLPAQAMDIIEKNLHAVLGKPRPRLLTIGLIGTLYSASRGVDAVRKGLNLAYDVKEIAAVLEDRAAGVRHDDRQRGADPVRDRRPDRRRGHRPLAGGQARHRARLRHRLELAPLAGDGAAHHVVRGDRLLPAARRRAGVQVHHAGLHRGDAGVAGGDLGVQRVRRPLRQLQRHLRLDRRRRPLDDLVLHHRVHLRHGRRDQRHLGGRLRRRESVGRTRGRARRRLRPASVRAPCPPAPPSAPRSPPRRRAAPRQRPKRRSPPTRPRRTTSADRQRCSGHCRSLRLTCRSRHPRSSGRRRRASPAWGAGRS